MNSMQDQLNVFFRKDKMVIFFEKSQRPISNAEPTHTVRESSVGEYSA